MKKEEKLYEFERKTMLNLDNGPRCGTPFMEREYEKELEEQRKKEMDNLLADLLIDFQEMKEKGFLGGMPKKEDNKQEKPSTSST